MGPFNYLSSLPPQVKIEIKGMLDKYSTDYLKMLTPSNRSQVKAAKTIHKLVDSAVETFLKDNRATCKKGCSYCCHVFIYATIDEARLITNHCAHNNIEVDRKVLEKQSKYTKDNWTGQELTACAFLKGGTCSIYGIRPIACRKFYVASDPKLCDINTGENRIAILNNMPLEILVGGVYQAREPDSLPRQLLKLLT